MVKSLLIVCRCSCGPYQLLGNRQNAAMNELFLFYLSY